MVEAQLSRYWLRGFSIGLPALLPDIHLSPLVFSTPLSSLPPISRWLRNWILKPRTLIKHANQEEARQADNPEIKFKKAVLNQTMTEGIELEKLLTDNRNSNRHSLRSSVALFPKTIAFRIGYPHRRPPTRDYYGTSLDLIDPTDIFDSSVSDPSTWVTASIRPSGRPALLSSIHPSSLLSWQSVVFPQPRMPLRSEGRPVVVVPARPTLVPPPADMFVPETRSRSASEATSDASSSTSRSSGDTRDGQSSERSGEQNEDAELYFDPARPPPIPILAGDGDDNSNFSGHLGHNIDVDGVLQPHQLLPEYRPPRRGRIGVGLGAPRGRRGRHWIRYTPTGGAASQAISDAEDQVSLGPWTGTETAHTKRMR